MTVVKVSPVSVIGTKGYFSENERLDMYFVHPEKIDAREYLKNVANSNGFDVVELQQVLENPPESGRSAREESGLVMVIKPGKLTSDFVIDTNNISGTTEDDYLNSEKGQLKNGDILLLSAAHAAGYIGRNTSIFLDENGRKAMCIGELIRIRPNEDEIEPFYLLGYLNTPYVRTLLKHSVRGQTVHLYPTDVRSLPVVLPLGDEQESIGKKLKESIERKIEAKKKKEEIDTIFAKYLPVDFDAPIEISFGYKKSSCVSERRNDPKTFSQGLAAYIQRLRGFGYKIETLDQLKNGDIHRGVQPEYHANGSISVIKTRDVNDSPIDWINTSKTEIEFYQKNKRAKIPQNALLVTSTGEGSWGRTSISDKSKAIADGHITIIPIDEALIDPYYVCAFLWTEYGKVQYYKRVRGCTGQTEIYPFDIKTIEVPRSENNIETKIGNNLRDYIQLSEVSQDYHQQAMTELEQLLSLKGGETQC